MFDPDYVVPLVQAAQAKASRDEILAARLDGQVAYLDRTLGDESRAGVPRATELVRRAADSLPLDSRPTYAGLRSLGYPGTELGDLWRACDLLREFRGDNHFNVLAANSVAPPVALRTFEAMLGMPRLHYAASRGWSEEAFAEADEVLAERGWVVDNKMTEAGTAARAQWESMTDGLQAPVFAALGDDLDEVVGLLTAVARDMAPHGAHPMAALL